MKYAEFAKKFLAAVYLETEETGRPYHRAENIISKYGLIGADHWISRISDDWEHLYFTEVSKVLGGYDAWSFRISGQGSREIEDEFDSIEEVRAFLLQGQADDLESFSSQLAPASGRYVSLSDNQEIRSQMVEGIEEIEKQISSSNEIDVGEKSDVLLSLQSARSIASKSKAILVGAFRYLVVERLKGAFESALEDALKLAILSVIATLVALLTVAI